MRLSASRLTDSVMGVALEQPRDVPHDVFISFALEDRDIANAVADRLRRDGITVWRFVDNPESGTWHLNQLRALRDSKLAIFIITPSSDRSSACLDEAQRAADPTQLGTVPLPLVVGAWNHVASDLWLLLSKWNGVVASPKLTEEALRRLAEIIHDKLGYRPIAALSTGQALVAVKDDLCAYLDDHAGLEGSAILEKAHELQVEHRGNMVAFSQFTYLDRELEAGELISDQNTRSKYISSYLRAYFDQVVAESHDDVATRLAGQISLGDTIVVSEYSRVLRHAFEILSETDRRLFQSLRIIVISRTGMLLVDDEPRRMRDELVGLGSNPETIAFGTWIDYLLNGVDDAQIGQVDIILFGVEAFSLTGEVVYPQIVKELDALRGRRGTNTAASRARVVAAGESYKVCRSRSEISKMIADPHYTVMPSAAIDLIVTDIGEFAAAVGSSEIDLDACTTSVKRKADRIREQLWPATEPLPVWNVSADLISAVKVVAADIDGTMTTQGSISVDTLKYAALLEATGCQVLLVTGRSAGWGAGLAQYLPHIVGVVAENGSVLLEPCGTEIRPVILDEAAPEAMPNVFAALDAAKAVYPTAVLGLDNSFRLTDRTIEVSSDIDPQVMASIAAEHGCTYTYSTVHHHFSSTSLNKQTGLLAALPILGFDSLAPRAEVITMGDSMNDEMLFDGSAFAATFGVRDILKWLPQLGDARPQYVTLAKEGRGFNELADLISRLRAGKEDAFLRRPANRPTVR